MKQYLLLSTLSVVFFSCGTERPLDTRRSDNNNSYKVDYLFTHDGCKVYRFYDRGHYVYFTNCTGEAIVYGDSVVIRNNTNQEVPTKRE